MLTTTKITDIKTRDDLRQHAITPAQAQQEYCHHGIEPLLTRGVAKHAKRNYLTAYVLALDEHGIENIYRIRMDDLNNRTIVSARTSRNQLNVWQANEWAELPAPLRTAVATAFPTANQYIQTVIGNAANGTSKQYDGLGTCIGTHRQDYITLFPEHADRWETKTLTVDDVRLRLRQWGSQILERTTSANTNN